MKDPDLRGHETVLIVEDDDNVRRTIAEFLPTLGYTVLAAHPSEAMRVVQAHPDAIDLLLADVVMPEMSGPQVSEKVRKLCPALKTIFISGYVDDAVTRHGILESNALFLQKPFTLTELSNKLREALAKP